MTLNMLHEWSRPQSYTHGSVSVGVNSVGPLLNMFEHSLLYVRLPAFSFFFKETNCMKSTNCWSLR